MHVSLTCKACGLQFKVHTRYAGKVGACPRAECGRKFLVPAATVDDETVNVASLPAPRSRAKSASAASSARATTPPSTPDDVAWLYRHAGVEQDAGLDTVDDAAPRRGEVADPRPARAAVRTTTSVAPPAARRPDWNQILRDRRVQWAALAVGMLLVGFIGFNAGRGRSPEAGAGTTSTPEVVAEQKRQAEKQQKAEALAASFHNDVQPYLKKFCVECHAGDQAEAGIVLDGFSGEEAARKDRKTWEKVVRMLEAGAMPPGDHETRPTADETKPVVAWMDERVFRVDCDLPADPGRVTVRRLNRNEYNNTVRDLLGVAFKPADDFPSDDVGYGFDNIGDVLSLPPLLMEKYLDAAEKVSEAAIVAADPKGSLQRVEGEQLTRNEKFQVTDENAVGLYSAGHVSHDFNFALAGEYRLEVEAMADQAGPDVAKVELSLDGKPVQTFEVPGQRKMGKFETKLRVAAGARTLKAAFINDYYNPKAKNPRDRDRNLYVKSLSVQGPIGVEASDLPEAHRRIVTARPDDKTPLRDAALQVLRPIARQAFRRPVPDDEVEPFVKLVEFAAKQGDPYERGLQVALQGILVSPHFLFRMERDSEPNNPKAKRTLTDFELASRLSYFLWSSMPDEELFRLAGETRLHQPDVLQGQVKRMLADPKSRAFVENFGGQWLNLRNLDELAPDPKLFPDYSPALRADMRKETELFFEAVVKEDRSLLDFLDGRFTFLNDRLARHYGLPAPAGGEFRKVELADDRRAGILTHASILTLTSDPTKTSPVKRGKWILENILGAPPPPPPQNVPELEATRKANPDSTLRQQLEIHRKNPACATCHRQMDPLGLGFEHFDAIGRWRDTDNGHPIDSSGTLPSGESFQTPAELRTILKSREKQFTRHFASQLLTYALGRGLEPTDRCTVDAIAEAAAKNGHRFSTLIQETVRSQPFLMRRGEGEER